MDNDTLKTWIYALSVVALVFVTLCLILAPKVVNNNSQTTVNEGKECTGITCTNAVSGVSVINETRVVHDYGKPGERYDPCTVWDNQNSGCYESNGVVCGNCSRLN